MVDTFRCGARYRRRRTGKTAELRFSGRLNEGLVGVFQFGFGHHAGDLVDHFSIFEKNQGWDGLDAELSWGDGIIIHIAFGEFDLFPIGACQLFDNGADCFAGAAPRCPEVHHCRFVRLYDFSLEAVVVNKWPRKEY